MTNLLLNTEAKTNQTSPYHSMLAISNRHLCDATEAPDDKNALEKYLKQLTIVKASNPKGIILREKDLSITQYKTLAKNVVKELYTNDFPIILHSYIDVALELKVPYIHLPLNMLVEISSTDDGIKKLSYFKSIGTSIHSVDDAKLARSLNATYCLAGNVFETDCKKGLPGKGLDYIRAVCQELGDIPVYALGGITTTNHFDCINAGAAGSAMMSGFMKM